MAPFLHSLFFQLRYRFASTEGQDLIEYALVGALISLGAVAGMQSVANDISSAYTHLATTLTSKV